MFLDEIPSNSPAGKFASLPADFNAYCVLVRFLSLLPFPHNKSIQHLPFKVINNNGVPGELHRLTIISYLSEWNSAWDRGRRVPVGTARPGNIILPQPAAGSFSPFQVLLKPLIRERVNLHSFSTIFFNCQLGRRDVTQQREGRWPLPLQVLLAAAGQTPWDQLCHPLPGGAPGACGGAGRIVHGMRARKYPLINKLCLSLLLLFSKNHDFWSHQRTQGTLICSRKAWNYEFMRLTFSSFPLHTLKRQT